MREVKVAHNHTTHQAQDTLDEIGDPDLEAPVPQTLATRKAKLVSTELVLNTTIKAAIVSLQEMVSVEQMTRGQ